MNLSVRWRAYTANNLRCPSCMLITKILYRQGGASYLQVLTSENNAFSAELNLAQARLNERLALVQLYNALGGGWEL
jgi:outer membrane protein TolC